MTDDKRLPTTWTATKLSEAAEISPAKQVAYCGPETPFVFVPMNAVKEEFGGIDVGKTRPFTEVAKGYTQFRTGDVILAKITPCMENGKVAVVPELSSPWAYGSTEFHVLRPSAIADPKWIAYILSQRSFRHDARAKMTGSAGQLRVPKSWLEDVLVPIPPHPEQRRIVAKIEELFSDLDAGVAALERARSNLKRYRAAVLNAAVNGTLVGNASTDSFERANWREIGEAIVGVEQGWSPKCEREPSENGDTWAVMTTTAIQPMRFDGSENKVLPADLQPRTNLEVQPGDVLITRAGPRSRAGIACYVRHTRPRLILCDKAYRFRCREEMALGEYVEVALNARPVLTALDEMKTGISDSGVNLTQNRFRQLRIPLPSLALQREIVAEVHRRLSVTEAAEVEVERGLTRAARLRQSILKRAFAGQLVPQIESEARAGGHR